MATLVNDDGSGGDANPIGGIWTTVTGFGALRRLSAQIANAAGSDTNSCAYANTVADMGDMWIQMEVAVTGGSDAGPALRINTGTGAQVFLQNASGGTDFNLYLFSGGYTLLDNDAGVYGVGDDVYGEVQGTTYITKQNSTTRNNVSNATLSTGRMGVNMYTGATRFINVLGGDFSAAGDTNARLIGGDLMQSILLGRLVN